MLQHYVQAITRLNKQGLLSYASRLVRGLNVGALSLTEGLLRHRASKATADLELPFEQKRSPAFHEGGGKVHMFYWVFAFLTISFRDEIFFLCKNNLLDSTSLVKTHADFAKMKKIKPIVKKYTVELTREGLSDLIKGKQLLAAIHAEVKSETRARDNTSPSITRVSLSGEEKILLERLSRFSTASYGWRTLYGYGLGSLRMVCSNKKAVQCLTGVRSKDIVAMENKSDFYRPGYFITVDHATRSIIVTVRGTTRLQDCITGITCTNTPLVLRAENGGIIHGVVHEGFYHSAGYLNSSILPKVVDTMKEFPEYDIITTGHSMGGACAALMTLLWTQLPEFNGKHHQLRSISFGSPGVVSFNLANSSFVKSKVHAYVLENDIVPRLSLASFEEFFRYCDQLGRGSAAKLSEVQFADKFADEIEQLYPCGSCFHILAPVGVETTLLDSFAQIRKIDQAKALKQIQLGGSMLAAHLPVNYMHAIAMQETRMGQGRVARSRE